MFLFAQAFIWQGLGGADLTPYMQAFNAPPPANPEIETPHSWWQFPLSNLANSIASQLMWIGSLFLWAWSKFFAFWQIVAFILAPSLSLGADYAFLSYINMGVVVMLVYSVIPFE